MQIISLLRLLILIWFAPLVGSSTLPIKPKKPRKSPPKAYFLLDDANISQDHLTFATEQLKAFSLLTTPQEFADYMIEEEKTTELKILLSIGRGKIYANKQFKALQALKNDAKKTLQSPPREGFLAYRDPGIPNAVIEIFESALKKVGINPQNIDFAIDESTAMASASADLTPLYKNKLCGEVTYPILTEIENLSFLLCISSQHANSFCYDTELAKATALHEVQHFIQGHVVTRFILSPDILNSRQIIASKRQREFTADVFPATLGLNEAKLIATNLDRYAESTPFNNDIHTEVVILKQAVHRILKAHYLKNDYKMQPKLPALKANPNSTTSPILKTHPDDKKPIILSPPLETRPKNNISKIYENNSLISLPVIAGIIGIGLLYLIGYKINQNIITKSETKHF